MNCDSGAGDATVGPLDAIQNSDAPNDDVLHGARVPVLHCDGVHDAGVAVAAAVGGDACPFRCFAYG